MACRHRWVPCCQEHYERCEYCDTYHSTAAPPPEEVYTADYWDGEKHSMLRDQIYNIVEHREGGVTKAEYVKGLIRTRERASVLEIGCAPGAILRMLRENMGFETVVGAEACECWQEICEVAGFQVHCYAGIFPQCTRHTTLRFDVILALDVFEHSHEPELFLAECARLLKLHGQLILMLPLVAERRPVPERMFHPVEHVYLHSERNMIEMLTDAGFKGFRMGRWTPGHETVTAVRGTE